LIRVTATVDEENELLRIAVNDNGGGIPQHAIDLIFHPFFTTKDVGKGTGLGLSVSYGIVEGMGGEIEARNEGDGACFEIILPAVNIGQKIAARAAVDVDATAREKYHKDPDQILRRSNIRIMVVDDEIDAMEIISAYLEGQGYAVSAANDGEDALAIAGIIAPDILITDIRMPQMDGNQLIRSIRERNPMIPVIVMTGHPGDAEMPHDTSEDAPVMVMAKPLDLKELHAIIDELVLALDIGG